MVWNYYELWLRVPVPYPSFADIGFLGFYPLCFVGLVVLIRRVSDEAPTWTLMLDSLITVLAGGFLAWEVMLEPIIPDLETGGFAAFTSLLWSIGTLGLVALCLAAWIWGRPARDRASVLLLLLGLSCFAIANLFYGRLAFEGRYAVGHPIDLGWHVGILLVAAAAIMHQQSSTLAWRAAGEFDPTTWRTMVGRTGLAMLAITGVSVLGAATVWAPTSDKHVAVGIILVGVLTAVRIGLGTIETERLAQRTRERDRLAAVAEERARAEESLARANEELLRSNAELQQFAYVASHDLQEPLRMVSSYTQLLARRYRGKIDEDADEFIGYAVEGVTRMQQLINDLLAYSRVGSRGKPFEPTNLGDVLQRTSANLEVAIAESGATVVATTSLPTVMGDPVLLAQVFQNLIGNALKYRGEAPPRVEVAAEANDSEWVVAVSDNGIGIAPEYFERIFLIFQRLHSRSEYAGTGIGLAITQRIVERHGGRIWVESTPGAGTTFKFTIPLSRERRGRL